MTCSDVGAVMVAFYRMLADVDMDALMVMDSQMLRNIKARKKEGVRARLLDSEKEYEVYIQSWRGLNCESCRLATTAAFEDCDLSEAEGKAAGWPRPPSPLISTPVCRTGPPSTTPMQPPQTTASQPVR